MSQSILTGYADTDDWRNTLPEDWTVKQRAEDGSEQEILLRDHPSLSKYQSKDEAVKALVHAQKLIGMSPDDLDRNYLRRPGENATDEEYEQFLDALGRPKEPGEYELPEMEFPEGFDMDESFQEAFLDQAHSLGLSPEQVSGLYEWFMPRAVSAFDGMREQQDQTRRQWLDELRGEHRDGVQNVLENARQAAMVLGGRELLDALSESGAGDNPKVINALNRAADLVLERPLRGSDNTGTGLSRDRLREMMRDPRYWDASRRDENYVQQVYDGFRSLYPGSHDRAQSS